MTGKERKANPLALENPLLFGGFEGSIIALDTPDSTDNYTARRKIDSGHHHTQRLT